jgi:adenylate cyclase
VSDRGARIVKTMGDGLLLEFLSVVDAVECAAAIQRLMVERNAETPETKRIVYCVGVHLGDVLIEGEDILGGQYRGAFGGNLRTRRRADIRFRL